MAKSTIWVLGLATISWAYAIAEPLDQPSRRDGVLVFEPFAEVRFTVTDNVNLAPKSQKRSGQAITVGGGFDASFRSRRVEAQAHLLVEGDRFLSGGFNNDVRAFFDGLGSIEVIPNHGYLDLGVGWEQVVVDRLGRVSLNPAAASRQSDGVGTVSISPVYRTRLTNWADAEVRLTHSRTFSADNGLDNSQTNSASLIVASSSSNRRLGFEAIAEYFNFDAKTRGGFNDVERATAFITTSYNINRNLALLARGGYETIDSRGFNDDPDGLIAMAGFRAQAGRSSSLQVLAGQRYDDLAVEADLIVNLNRNFSLGASYANAIGTGSQSQFSQFAGRFFRSRGISGKASEVELLAVERLINQDSQGIGEGFGAINQAYRQQIASVFARGDFKNDTVYLNAYYEDRDFDVLSPLDPPIDDRGLSVSAQWVHEFTPRLDGNASVIYQKFKTDSPVLSDTDTVSGGVGLNYLIADNIELSANAIHTNRSATFSRDEYVENAIIFGLRVGF